MALTFRPTQPLDVTSVLPTALLDQHLKVDPNGAEATLIAALARAACGAVERYTSISLAKRSWLISIPTFSPVLSMPIGPIHSVDAIGYRDDAELWQTIAQGGWYASGSFVRPATAQQWPVRGSDVMITVTAGYDDPGTEAPALVAAALMMLTHLWRNREGQGDPATIGLPATSIALCDLDRAPVIA